MFMGDIAEDFIEAIIFDLKTGILKGIQSYLKLNQPFYISPLRCGSSELIWESCRQLSAKPPAASPQSHATFATNGCAVVRQRDIAIFSKRLGFSRCEAARTVPNQNIHS